MRAIAVFALFLAFFAQPAVRRVDARHGLGRAATGLSGRLALGRIRHRRARPQQRPKRQHQRRSGRSRWRARSSWRLPAPIWPRSIMAAERLDDRIGSRSAAQLIELMLTRSDNAATDVLIRNLGGPGRVQEWLNFNNMSRHPHRPHDRAIAGRQARPVRPPRFRFAAGDDRFLRQLDRGHDAQAGKPGLPAVGDEPLHHRPQPDEGAAADGHPGRAQDRHA